MATDPPDAVAKFHAVAHAFCAWIEGGPLSTDEEVIRAARLLAGLYAAALNLPPPRDASGRWPPDVPALEEVQAASVMARLRHFPLQFYWHACTSLVEQPGQMGTGDVTDDLGDIWRDIRPGLVAYDEGRPDEAVWQWRATFAAHWGAHVTGALTALHDYQHSPMSTRQST
jgi:hypothetical protein